MDSYGIIQKLTLQEMAALCSGKDFWHLKGIERLGLPAIMVTDGPHGLRKQEGDTDHLGINESVPATCFPAACATACSFDVVLMGRIGRAMGEECRQEGVAVLLGPAANIKRGPLCGRSFEYFSEDPYLSGEMAAATVTGIQSQGIGACVKHFAANNQEQWRMTSNSVVDDRALNEIYLAGFEIAAKKGKPWTFMCSYNLLNGIYASENVWLLCDVLRDTWGFDGLVISDWGATDDRVEGVRAGMDVEMPYSGGFNDADVEDAVKAGVLDKKDLEHNAQRVVELILKAQVQKKSDFRYNASAHHALAREAAAASSVLLKNDANMLPLKEGQKVALVGAFAKTPRYQGAGSSKINPTRLDNAFDAFKSQGIDFEYAQGYALGDCVGEDSLISEACRIAQGKDVVVIFAGLPDEYESEGYDRKSMSLPAGHNKLIHAVAEVNENVVVVLQLGAPVLMPWADKVKSILVAYLSGQAGGSAVTDLLTGRVCPSGKLAESWPCAPEDVPCHHYFPGTSKSVEYRESIFVGYRYYATVKKAVAYPFGHGLSYTGFSYEEIMLSKERVGEEDTLDVSVVVKNTGGCAGAEVVQLYISMEGSKIFRPAVELKGFEKVHLAPGERKRIVMQLNRRSFSYYNAPEACWAVEGGRYQVKIGASSADIRLAAEVDVAGDGKETFLQYLEKAAPVYYNMPAGELHVSGDAFAMLYGRELPPSRRVVGEPFTRNSTLNDVKDTRVGRLIYNTVSKHANKIIDQNSDHIKNMMESMLYDLPLRTLSLYSQGAFTPMQLDGVVDMLNGKFSGDCVIW